MSNDAPTVPFLWMEPFPGVTLGLLGVTLGGITPSYLSLLVVDIVWIAKFLHGLVAIGLVVLVGLHRMNLQNLQNQNLQNLTFVPPDGPVTRLTVYRPDLGAPNRSIGPPWPSRSGPPDPEFRYADRNPVLGTRTPSGSI